MSHVLDFLPFKDGEFASPDPKAKGPAIHRIRDKVAKRLGEVLAVWETYGPTIQDPKDGPAIAVPAEGGEWYLTLRYGTRFVRGWLPDMPTDNPWYKVPEAEVIPILKGMIKATKAGAFDGPLLKIYENMQPKPSDESEMDEAA